MGLKRQQQILEQIEVSQLPAEATYTGYDADSETHLVQTNRGVQPVKDLLTNAGLNSGDPIELINGALDAMPRHKPTPDVIQPWVNPIQLGACWCGYRRESGQKQCFTMDRQLGCGGTSGDALFRRDQDPYCRESFPEWKFVLDSNRRGLATGGAPACHLQLAIPLSADGSLWIGVNFVIGIFTFSTSVSEGFFPQFWRKVPNPRYGGYVAAPPGERYLDCREAKGEEFDMQWELLETIPVSDYVPSKLIRPAYPGGSSSFPQYESQYWLVTATGSTKVLTVPDFNLPEDAVSRRKPQQVWLSVDEQGVFQVDTKIGEPDANADNYTDTKIHFEVQGGVAVEVPESRSWRRLLTNNLTDTPLEGEAHPCVSTYQGESGINVAEIDRKVVRISPTTPLDDAKLIAGDSSHWSFFRCWVGITVC